MQVLLTMPSLEPSFGGPVAKARALRATLSRLGHQVTLIGAGMVSGDGTVGLKPLGRFHGTPIPLSLHRLVRAVRDADVVHIIGYRDPVSTVAALGAWIFGVPYVEEPVGMRRRRARSLLLKASYDFSLGGAVMRNAHLVVATSSREAVELREDGVPSQRLAVRPNGLDLTGLDPLPLRGAFRAELGLPVEVPLVVYLGRLCTTKGLPQLVEAAARMDGVHLAVVGPDDHDGTLEAIARASTKCGADGRVHVLRGGLWGHEKLHALVDADLFCSISMTESFGLAAGEAAACGTATIVSDQCGVAEWLGDGVAVVPYGDVPRLSATIERLLRNPAERHALGERGRIAARALSWETIAKQQVALYERVLHAT